MPKILKPYIFGTNLGGPPGASSENVYATLKKEISYLQEDVRKARSEVCAIDIKLFLPGHIDVLALGTVNLDSACRQLFRKAKWKHRLAFA